MDRRKFLKGAAALPLPAASILAFFKQGKTDRVCSAHHSVENYGGTTRSAATNEFWESNVMSSSNPRPLTPELMEQALRTIRKGGVRTLTLEPRGGWRFGQGYRCEVPRTKKKA